MQVMFVLGLEFALSNSDELAPGEITRIGLQDDMAFIGSAIEVRNLCLKILRKSHGVSLLGSAANARHCMHVGLGQPAEVPTQTTERVENALVTLRNIERFCVRPT